MTETQTDRIVDIMGSPFNLLAIENERAMESIVTAIVDAGGGLLGSCGISGAVDASDGSRAATDDECHQWDCSVVADGRFDVRQPLPGQVAAWLREVAGQLQDAAERIAAIDCQDDDDQPEGEIDG